MRSSLLASVLAGCLAGMAVLPAAPFPPTHLRAVGRAFRTADGSRFSWRGLSAFQLVEMVAHGRSADAVRLLDWAATHGVTVVRVLAMADVIFKLSPEEGRRALPDLLTLAHARGLTVEVVALADTGLIPVALPDQVKAVGAICSNHANCVLEIANEPWARHTQRAETGDAAVLQSLRPLVPAGVPVSLGSAPADDSVAYAGGDYVTVHIARADGENGWRHVLRMQVAETLSRTTGKPVVDDEPIGAGERSEPGRRDPDPNRWFAKGVLARVLAVGTTFHYEAGLHALVPRGRQAACFQAWREGLDALPRDVEEEASYREIGQPGAAVVSLDGEGARGVFLRQGERRAWAVAVGVTGRDPIIRWSPGWRPTGTRRRPGVAIVTAERR